MKDTKKALKGCQGLRTVTLSRLLVPNDLCRILFVIS